MAKKQIDLLKMTNAELRAFSAKMESDTNAIKKILKRLDRWK